MSYKIVIGLEVHVELKCSSKIFCSCQLAYDSPANSHCCPVCLGQPASLPLLNRQAVDHGLLVAGALDCQIQVPLAFDRKHYLYPDLPKGYQITQYYRPLGLAGSFLLEDDQGGRQLRIKEIHLEEDAGKMVHDAATNCSYIDFNRSGLPLLEIVTEPDLYSASEAVAFLEQLRNMLIFLGVSDCRMQDGAFRADVNISVKEEGQSQLGPRTEMKNMNSFKAIARAIDYEQGRQIALLEQGLQLAEETMKWDELAEKTVPMRTKGGPLDYRYCPDMDLDQVIISKQEIARVLEAMPELPSAKRARYRSDWGLSAYDASVLTSSPYLAQLFEDCLDLGVQAKATANWIMGELLQFSRAKGLKAEDLSLEAADLALIVKETAAGRINRQQGQQVLLAVLEEGVQPEQYISQQDFSIVEDQKLLAQTVKSVIMNNPQALKDYCQGKSKVSTFIFGQVMRALGGKAQAALLKQIIQTELESLKGDMISDSKQNN